MRKAIEAIVNEGELVDEKELDGNTHFIYRWRDMIAEIVINEDNQFVGLSCRQETK